MSILHTLEDFDSRVEKARANLLRWFVLAAVVAVAAVVVSWSVRQFISRKSESKWIPFDTQLNVRGGFLGFPMVTATHDPDIAASEVRATAGQSWGEIARAAQAGRAGEVGRLTDSLSNLQGASGTDPAIRTLSTFLQSDGTAGLEGQISRAEALRGWLDSHQNLSANLTQEGSPGLELELDGGRLVFRFDPKLPPSSVESILGFVKSDAFANAALVWNTTERCYDVKLSPDRPEAPKELNSRLEGIRPDQPSYSLFRGTLASRPMPSKDAGSNPTLGLSLICADSLGREHEWIPLAMVAEGVDFLPSATAPAPEKSEIKILASK